MSLRIDSRSYTNVILTGIALFLCLLVLHAYRISVASEARAQQIGTPRPTASLGSGAYSPPGHSAPVDVRNAQLVRDVDVAAATHQVAEANREIALALREVAEAIRSAGSAISTGGAPGRLVSTSTVIPPAPPTGGPLPLSGTSPAAPTPAPESLNISVESAR